MQLEITTLRKRTKSHYRVRSPSFSRYLKAEHDLFIRTLRVLAKSKLYCACEDLDCELTVRLHCACDDLEGGKGVSILH